MPQISSIAIGLALCLLCGCKTLELSLPCGTYQARTQFFPFPLSLHVLHIDPNRCSIDIETANPNGIGVAQTFAIAERRNALAAINGGFFLEGKYEGVNAHILKKGRRWYSDPRLSRGAIGWSKGGLETVIGRLGMNWQVQIAGRLYPVTRLNKPRSTKNTILYTWAMGSNTLNRTSGNDIVISNGVVTKILSNEKNTAIPTNGYVYSVGHDASVNVKNIQIGAPAKPMFSFEPKAINSNMPIKNNKWASAENILGGTPILVFNGKTITDFSVDKTADAFLYLPRPRTAVCVKPDKTWLLVVIDGDDPYLSYGYTMEQLANFMQTEGCQNALNLDGGSSSAMVVKGRLVSNPSLGTPDSVGDALVVSLKQ